MNHSGSSFLCGYAVFSDFLFFSKCSDDLVDREQENSSFFVHEYRDWQKYEFDGNWSSISMSSYKKGNDERVVVAVSSQGEYWEVLPVSVIESYGKIQNIRFSLSNLENIDGTIYACGMGRSVLRRISEGVWEEIGPGDNSDENLIVGFEDIAGFSKKEIYAVGWQGEIWCRKGNRWKQLDSPTSVILNAVCCGDDGRVYAVGDDGILVVGRGDEWEIIEIDMMDNFQDIASYGGMIYLCTDYQILKLTDHGLVLETDFEDTEDKPRTCLHLLSCEDGLFSMGPKDLFLKTEDLWHRIV